MTNRRIHTIFFFLFLSGVFILSSCENDIKEVQNLGSGRENVEEGTNIKSILSIGGAVKAQLSSPYMISRQADSASTIFPKSLFVTFYNDSLGFAESFLRANYGKYFVNDSKVFLKDSVVFYNIKGDTMHTSELWWDQNKEEIYTDKRIKFFQKIPYSIIYGTGFHSKQDFSSYYFDNVENSQVSVADTTLPGQ